MSYCRFGEADVYIYDDMGYGLYCMACSLMPTTTAYSRFLKKDIIIHKGFKAGYDYDAMLAHVAEHRAAGDYIPEDVDERLIFERDCNHDFNSNGICKYCWGREDMNIVSWCSECEKQIVEKGTVSGAVCECNTYS